MNSRPSASSRRTAITKRTTGARRNLITKESLLEDIEALQQRLEEVERRNTTDDDVLAARLARIESEMNTMYWYILAPCLICAVVLGSMAVRSIIDRYMGG